MSQNLQDLITKTLGVVQTAPAATAPAAPKFASSPERPEPQYEFRISVVRLEYGGAVITASSPKEAFDLAGSEDIDWYKTGDTDWDSADTEQISNHPVNQDEIDEWDDKYGRKYTADGDPKCTACDEEMSENKLRPSPLDDNEWFCDDCYDDNVPPLNH